MKNHIVFKFLALMLCAGSLLGTLACAGLLGSLTLRGISNSYTVSDAHNRELAQRAETAALQYAAEYASRTLGGCPQKMVEKYFPPIGAGFHRERVFFSIADSQGNPLESTKPGTVHLTAYPVEVSGVEYLRLISQSMPIESMEKGRQAGANVFSTLDSQGTSQVYRYVREMSPAYQVTVYLAPNALTNEQGWRALELTWNYRRPMILLLGICTLLFAVGAVYLCCAAGKTPGSDKIQAGGLNRVPIELYAGAAAGAVIFCIAIFYEGVVENIINRDIQVALAMILYVGFLASLTVVGFLYCLIAQLRTPGGYLLRNSLVGRGLRLFKATVLWLWRDFPKYIRLGFFYGKQLFVRIFRAGIVFLRWVVMMLLKPLSPVLRFLKRMLKLLPFTWQCILTLALCLLIVLVPIWLNWGLGFLLGILTCCGVVIYSIWCFGTLLEATARMRSGDLESTVDSSLMVGGFREYAEELNGLAEVAMVAAKNQLKSERMKTELITNVSHDIKTPLTSIINYVELLQVPHDSSQEQQYLEVLQRQSRRLKKLIEDLIELSKASSGNLQVDMITMDAAEAVNQALGEFADKLENANLTPVFHAPETPVSILADGRLMWRAMSNVLSNAVKYALPGTRIYVDVGQIDEKIVISLKNISRDALNISAEELLERFVRGDASRNTEGSGLGLNIAKSLMEVQGGKLKLLVDGDLFKVSLIFQKAPGAKGKRS